MAALATHADVAARWRPLTAAEQTVAAAFLDDASALVRSKVPDIDARIAADANLAAVAKGVVANMVRRVMLNPEGWRSSSIDDFRRERDTALRTGLLFVSDDELVQLQPTGLGGAYVVSLGGL
jgi:hypothetical protein